MKMISALFLMALMVISGGCSSIGCKIQGAASGVIASGLSKTLSCSNPNQVLADVTAIVAKSNICSSEPKPGEKGGAIASLACPIIAQIAVTELGAQIPVSWQCDPSIAKQGVAMAITAACNQIPF